MSKYSAERAKATEKTTYATATPDTRQVIDALNCGRSRILDRTTSKKSYVMPEGMARVLGIDYEPHERATPANTPVLAEVHVVLDALTAYIATVDGPERAEEDIRKAAFGQHAVAA